MNNLTFFAYGSAGLLLLIVGLNCLSQWVVEGLSPRELDRLNEENEEEVSRSVRYGEEPST